MTKFPITVGALLLIFLAGICMADSLELADGTILEGDFAVSFNVPAGTLPETELRVQLNIDQASTIT